MLYPAELRGHEACFYAAVPARSSGGRDVRPVAPSAPPADRLYAFRCCAMYLFISNIVTLSRPNTF